MSGSERAVIPLTFMPCPPGPGAAVLPGVSTCSPRGLRDATVPGRQGDRPGRPWFPPWKGREQIAKCYTPFSPLYPPAAREDTFFATEGEFGSGKRSSKERQTE